ncbi:MAG: hypothetical protein IPJ40_17980 [Saprospirales bacterium]|nr:hypothetical protein [Saprospirales bacterium]
MFESKIPLPSTELRVSFPRWKTSGKAAGQGQLATAGFSPEVYAVLESYLIEAEKSIYQADSVSLHYPLYFGERLVKGRFEDKMSSDNAATGVLSPV